MSSMEFYNSGKESAKSSEEGEEDAYVFEIEDATFFSGEWFNRRLGMIHVKGQAILTSRGGSGEITDFHGGGFEMKLGDEVWMHSGRSEDVNLVVI